MEENKRLMVFVIGTGRSGTHWIGYILRNHPDIHVSIEKGDIFYKVTNMALNPSIKPELFPKVVKLYKEEYKKAEPKHYVDKSHPNIWLVEDLIETFPDVLFIGIKRDPYATVSSMLLHSGVRSWYKKWDSFPLPNHFLGITNQNIEKYMKLPLASKCALRWVSHMKRMEELETKLGSKLLVLSYEKLILDTEAEMKRLEEFLQLSTPIPMPKVKKESLNKWREKLSAKEIKNIKQIVGQEPMEYEID